MLSSKENNRAAIVSKNKVNIISVAAILGGQT